jgi:NADH:ubiquinone oxidoreductase subunit 6 (subunit J)
MVDVISTAKGFLPNMAGVGSGIMTVITWVVIMVILGITTAIVLFIVLQRRRYNNTLVIFDKINGRWIDTFRDKGMSIKFGNMGIKVMYFKKLKTYEPFPTIQSGNRKFYFKRRADGTLENFEMKDDESPEKQNLISMNQSMLYHHTGINRGLENRYKKEDWKAYIPMAVGITAIIIICLFVWLIMDKWMTLSNSANTGVENANKVMESANNMLARLDNVMAHQGSGYVTKPAGNGT